jgi:hypothetical protein
MAKLKALLPKGKGNAYFGPKKSMQKEINGGN